ncbi:MAG: glutamine--fructose-6-phosphate transaminase (isomerizing) [Candidatus Aenigmatarchaeota archaeon]
MCGIIGYVGNRNAAEVLFNGLKKLTYRGYDSWGFGFKTENGIEIIKGVGDIENSQCTKLNRINANIGISHTRWATHGEVNYQNAHPHLCCSGKIAVVHNGIIENYQDLKKELIKKGHKFSSDTDTEVIPHLIEENYKKTNNFFEAAKNSSKILKGCYAFVAMHKDFDGLVGIKDGPPLMIGINGNEQFIASDVVAFMDHAKDVIYIDDKEMAIIRNNRVEIINTKTDNKIEKQTRRLIWDISQASKLGYDHYMLKEILEQPTVIKQALAQDKDLLMDVALEILRANQVVFTACGTSRYAALIGRYLFSKLAGKFCDVIMASEFHYFVDSINKNTLVIAISQSGETADVIEGVKKAKESGAKIVSIVNIVDSSLARMSDKVIYINAGPEICVAATKTFTNQLVILYLLAFAMANKLNEGYEKIYEISNKIEQTIKENYSNLKDIAKRVKDKNDFYYIGRGINFAMASEGALKLKEISYAHAEGMPAGELKHGTIALIEKGTPVISICPKDYTFYETLSNLLETKARGSYVIGVSDENNEAFDAWIMIPKVEEIFYPLVVVIPLQLFAYYIAVEKGKNPDKPRNLAKSVTVK